MGSITPLLDTLLHQIKGRQQALDAYVRPRPGTVPVNAIDTFHDAGEAVRQTHSPPNERRDGRGDFEARMKHLQPSGASDEAITSTRPLLSKEPVSSTGSSRLMLSQAASALNAALDQLPLASRPVDVTDTLRVLAHQQGVCDAAPKTSLLLQQAVARSGVFFEAHLARWQDGMYPLAQLQEESRQREKQAGTGRQAQWGDEVIGQQLAILAGRPLRIQGEAWPAALFGLTLYPPTEDDSPDENNEQSPLSSTSTRDVCRQATLTVDTRRWGTVQIDIALVKGLVTLAIDASAAVNGERLDAYADKLSERLLKRRLPAQLSFTGVTETPHG